MNFENQVSKDDEKLIKLLKIAIVREPSKQFAESTIEKFLIDKAKQREVYKPLKSPLYMMLVISLILLAPIFFPASSQISLPIIGIELENLFEIVSIQLDSWYTFSLLLLGLVSLIIVRFELRMVRFPFN